MRNLLHQALLAAALRTGHLSSATASYGSAGTIPRFSPRTRKWHGNEGQQSHQCSAVWPEGLLLKRQPWLCSTPEGGQRVPHLCKHGSITEWQHCHAGDTWSREALPAQRDDTTARLQRDSHGKDSPGKHSSICCETGDTAHCICIHSCLFLRESQIQNRALSMLWCIPALHLIYAYNHILPR